MLSNVHIGLGALSAALAVGLMGAKAAEAVGRNAGSATPAMVQWIVAIALAEAIVVHALFLVK